MFTTDFSKAPVQGRAAALVIREAARGGAPRAAGAAGWMGAVGSAVGRRGAFARAADALADAIDAARRRTPLGHPGRLDGVVWRTSFRDGRISGELLLTASVERAEELAAEHEALGLRALVLEAEERGYSNGVWRAEPHASMATNERFARTSRERARGATAPLVDEPIRRTRRLDSPPPANGLSIFDTGCMFVGATRYRHPLAWAVTGRYWGSMTAKMRRMTGYCWHDVYWEAPWTLGTLANFRTRDDLLRFARLPEHHHLMQWIVRDTTNATAGFIRLFSTREARGEADAGAGGRAAAWADGAADAGRGVGVGGSRPEAGTDLPAGGGREHSVLVGGGGGDAASPGLSGTGSSEGGGAPRARTAPSGAGAPSGRAVRAGSAASGERAGVDRGRENSVLVGEDGADAASPGLSGTGSSGDRGAARTEGGDDASRRSGAGAASAAGLGSGAATLPGAAAAAAPEAGAASAPGAALPVVVREVATEADLRDFVDVALRVGDRSRSVPLLHDTIRSWWRGTVAHESPVTLLVARRGRDVVGRTTAHASTQLDAKLGTRAQLFGATVAADTEALAALVDELESRARTSGARELVGPVALLPNQTGGVIASGFGERGFMDSAWNPAWVPGAFEALGFETWNESATWIVRVPSGGPGAAPAAGDVRSGSPGRPGRRAGRGGGASPDGQASASVGRPALGSGEAGPPGSGARGERAVGPAPDAFAAPSAEELAEAGIRIRRGSRLRFRRDVEELRRLTNAAFDELPYYTAISRGQMRDATGGLAALMDPRLWLTAVDAASGESVGFVLAIPDPTTVLQRSGGALGARELIDVLRSSGRLDGLPRRLDGGDGSPRDAILVIQGVHPSARSRGISTLLGRALGAALVDGGYRALRSTYVGHDNPASARQFERMGGRPLHETVFYRRTVRSGAAGPGAAADAGDDARRAVRDGAGR